jgi:hypothetical protein
MQEKCEMLEIQYTWDPAMMRVDMIDLSCTGAHRAIMLEIAGKVTPSQRPIATLNLEIY